jgi:hypothetical protein
VKRAAGYAAVAGLVSIYSLLGELS